MMISFFFFFDKRQLWWIVKGYTNSKTSILNSLYSRDGGRHRIYFVIPCLVSKIKMLPNRKVLILVMIRHLGMRDEILEVYDLVRSWIVIDKNWILLFRYLTRILTPMSLFNTVSDFVWDFDDEALISV